MTDDEREEICVTCGKRRPLHKLYPRASNHEETRQYACRRVFACLVRKVWKTRSISSLYDD